MAEPAPSTETPSARLRRGQRRGRRIAQAVYYTLAGALALAFTVQITNQVFFTANAANSPRYDSCMAGLHTLYSAIQDGRTAAEQGVEGERNEEAALARYRAEVEPVWRHRQRVAELCQTDDSSSLLDALERLRYSEEHGVRRQAAELTELRQRVHRMFDEQRSTAPLPSAPSRGQ